MKILAPTLLEEFGQHSVLSGYIDFNQKILEEFGQHSVLMDMKISDQKLME